MLQKAFTGPGHGPIADVQVRVLASGGSSALEMEKLARAALALEARCRHLVDTVELVPLRSGIILALGHLLLPGPGAWSPRPDVRSSQRIPRRCGRTFLRNFATATYN